MSMGRVQLDDRRLAGIAAALALVVFFCPLVLPHSLLDPDEGLHGAIALEMAEGDDWLVPRWLGRPFLDKPALFLWAQAATIRLLGPTEAAVRLPGLLCGLAGAAMTALVGWRMLDRTTGLVASIFHMTMVLPVALVQAAACDVVLVPCASAALLAVWELRVPRRRLAWSSALAAAVALSCLAKGLSIVALVLVGCAAYFGAAACLAMARYFAGARHSAVARHPGLAQAGSGRWLAWVVLAAALGVLLAAPWYLAVERRLPGYLYYYFHDRHWLGFATPSQPHGGQSWWYYVPVLLAGGLPWTLCLPAALGGRAQCSAPQSLPAERSSRLRRLGSWWDCAAGLTSPAHVARPRPTPLIWSWLIGGAVFLSLAHSKLATYAWPLFPLMAILAAEGWRRMIARGRHPAHGWAIRAVLLPVLAFAPLAMPIAVLLAGRRFDVRFDGATWLLVAAAGATWWIVLWLARARRPEATLAAVASSLAVQFLCVMAVVLPPIAARLSARHVAEYLNERFENTGQAPREVWLDERRLGSLAFYLRGELRRRFEGGRLRLVRFDAMPHVETETMLIVPEHRAAAAGTPAGWPPGDYVRVGDDRIYHAAGPTSPLRDSDRRTASRAGGPRR